MKNRPKKAVKKNASKVHSCNLAGVRNFLKLPKRSVDSVQFTAIIRTLLRLRERRKTDKSALLCEGIRLLFEKEIGDRANV